MAYHENAPLLSNTGRQVSLASILANVDDINAVPVKSIATNQAVHLPDSSSDDEKKNKSDDGKSQAQAAAPVVFVDNHKDVSSNDGIGKSLDDGVDRAKAQDVSTDVGPGISMVTKTQDNTKTQTQTSQVEGIQPTLKFDIDIQHVGITETTTTTVNGKTLTVYGGGGTSYANIYPDNYNKVDKDKLVAQTKGETIDYSDKKFGSYDNVVIYADNPNLFNATTTSRTINLTPSQPEGFQITSITITSSSFPKGFSILNGVQSGNTWTIQKDDPTTLDVVEGFTISNNGSINLTPSQPEGFQITSITITSSSFPKGFSILTGVS